MATLDLDTIVYVVLCFIAAEYCPLSFFGPDAVISFKLPDSIKFCSDRDICHSITLLAFIIIC
jgi:hypothetical protein